MADHWFFEADLIALRQEWARLMREYGRTGCAEVLARAHEAHARYSNGSTRCGAGPRARRAV